MYIIILSIKEFDNKILTIFSLLFLHAIIKAKFFSLSFIFISINESDVNNCIIFLLLFLHAIVKAEFFSLSFIFILINESDVNNCIIFLLLFLHAMYNCLSFDNNNLKNSKWLNSDIIYKVMSTLLFYLFIFILYLLFNNILTIFI